MRSADADFAPTGNLLLSFFNRPDSSSLVCSGQFLMPLQHLGEVEQPAQGHDGQCVGIRVISNVKKLLSRGSWPHLSLKSRRIYDSMGI